MPHFIHQREVDFADTDMGGIVHFARYLVYSETAEHRLLESLGHSVVNADENGCMLCWPRVSVSADYLRPIHFGQTVAIEVNLVRVGGSSIDYLFELRCGDDLCARIQETVVHCRLHETDGIQAVRIPDPLREKLQSLLEGPQD